MSEPLPLRADKVCVRRLLAHDLQAFQAYRHDAEVARYQGWRPQSDAQALAFLQSMAAAPLWQPGQWLQLGMAHPDSDVLMGDVGLYLAPARDYAELGFSLARAYQGQGRAAAALRLLLPWLQQAGVPQLRASTDARNKPSQQLLERLGFTRVAEQAACYHGEACVEFMYTVTL